MNHPALRVDDAYLRLNGTSMATAVVSGTVALILQANHALTPNAVKAILQFTALPVRDDQGARYDVLTQGTGSVNAAGAIEVAAHIDPEKGRLVMVADHHTGSLDGDRRRSTSWAESIVWRDAVSFGPVVAVNELAWSENIVWGSDDNIVWGSSDNIVWGSSDNIVWGSNIVWGRQHRLGKQHRVGQYPSRLRVWKLDHVGNGCRRPVADRVGHA